MKRTIYSFFAIILVSLVCTVSVSGKSKKNTDTVNIETGQKCMLILSKNNVVSGSKKDIKRHRIASLYKWKSSNKKVAKVSKKGTVTGIKKGNATITAVLKEDKKFKLSFNVKVNRVKVSKDLSVYDGISKNADTGTSGKYIIDKVYYIAPVNTKKELGLKYSSDDFSNSKMLTKQNDSKSYGMIIDSAKDGEVFAKAIKQYFDDCSLYGVEPNSNIGENYNLFNKEFFEKNSLFIYTGYNTRTTHTRGSEGRIEETDNGKYVIKLIDHFTDESRHDVSYTGDMVPFTYIAVIPKNVVSVIDDFEEFGIPILKFSIDKENITLDTKTIYIETYYNYRDSVIKIKVNGTVVAEKKFVYSPDGFEWKYTFETDFSGCKTGDIVEITREYAGSPIEYTPISQTKQFVIQ